MEELRINKPEDAETITVKLSKEKTPIAFKNKVEELIDEGMLPDEAEKFVEEADFFMEMYYQKGYGLFLVESEPLDYTDICSPYNADVYQHS